MVRMIIRNSIMIVIARFSLDTPRSDDFFELSHIGFRKVDRMCVFRVVSIIVYAI